MTIDRRSLVKYAAMAPVMGALPHLVRAANAPSVEKADYTLRISARLGRTVARAHRLDHALQRTISGATGAS